MSAKKLDDAFVFATAAQIPDVDVFALAVGVREYAQKVNVENECGLLLTWARRAEKARRDGGAARVQVEREHYAEFWLQLLQLVAVERATPLEVAALLRAGQGAGFPALNPVLIERLEKVGKFWPPISFTPEAKAR